MQGSKNTSDPTNYTAFAKVAAPSTGFIGGKVSALIGASDGSTPAVAAGSFEYHGYTVNSAGRAHIVGQPDEHTGFAGVTKEIANASIDDLDPGTGTITFRIEAALEGGTLYFYLKTKMAALNITPTSGTIYYEITDLAGAAISGL